MAKSLFYNVQLYGMVFSEGLCHYNSMKNTENGGRYKKKHVLNDYHWDLKK